MDIKKIITILSVTGVAVSCATELVAPSGGAVDKGINVNVVEGKVYSTRSESADGELFDSFVIGTIGGREVRMDAYVSDITPDCLNAETKGLINSSSTLTTFKMSAYAQDQWYDNTIPEGSDGSKTNPNAAGEYFTGFEVSRPSTESSDWSIANSPNWLNNVELTFWSRYTGTYLSTDIVPVPDASAANKAGISITNNGSDDLIYAFNKEKRKFDEETGKITEGSGTYKTDTEDVKKTMLIKFYHALSAIRFDISGLKADGLTIKKVTFKGAVSKANCVITNGRNNDNDADSLIFAWTPKTVTGTETNTGDFSVTFTASEDFTALGLDGTTENALMPLTSDKILFMIPQTVENKNITVELVYEDASGNEVTKTASLNDQTTPWEAGKYYTYKLSVDKGLSVTVDDDLSDNVKNNLSIKYEGSKSAYIRALIVAYWVDASGNYLSNCDYKTKGSLKGLASGDWEENTTDGFFYYNAEVESGNDIGPYLLTSYTAPAAPVEGATLRMVIAAQATEYDSSKTCYEAFNSNNTSK